MFSGLSSQFESAMAFALVWVAAVLSVSAFIRKVSKDADRELDASKRAELSQALLNYKKDGLPIDWVPNFYFVLNRFFGNNHLTRRCFYRSSLISMFCYLMISASFIPFSTMFNTNNVEVIELIKLLVGTAVIGLLINIPIDFISLYETRWVMGLKISISKKLLLDFFFTILLTSFWGTFVVWLFGLMVGINLIGVVGLFINAFASFITGDGDEIDRLMFVILVLTPTLTSFSTSVWLWLHGFAELVIRLLSPLSVVLSWLDVKETPVRAIGTVINIVVWLIAIIFLPLALIYGLLIG